MINIKMTTNEIKLLLKAIQYYDDKLYDTYDDKVQADINNLINLLQNRGR